MRYGYRRVVIRCLLAADARAVLLLLLTGRRALVRRFSCLPLAGDGITLRRGLWNRWLQTVAGLTARAGKRRGAAAFAARRLPPDLGASLAALLPANLLMLNRVSGIVGHKIATTAMPP